MYGDAIFEVLTAVLPKIQVFWYVNAVLTGSYERSGGPAYVRISEIRDKICSFRNLGTQSEYVKLADWTVN